MKFKNAQYEDGNRGRLGFRQDLPFKSNFQVTWASMYDIENGSGQYYVEPKIILSNHTFSVERVLYSVKPCCKGCFCCSDKDSYHWPWMI